MDHQTEKGLFSRSLSLPSDPTPMSGGHADLSFRAVPCNLPVIRSQPSVGCRRRRRRCRYRKQCYLFSADDDSSRPQRITITAH